MGVTLWNIISDDDVSKGTTEGICRTSPGFTVKFDRCELLLHTFGESCKTSIQVGRGSQQRTRTEITGTEGEKFGDLCEARNAVTNVVCAGVSHEELD